MASPLGGLGEYRKNAVGGASPLQLVVMLYDGALKCCEAGKQAMSQGDLEAQHKNLSKAQKIISELVASLDMAQGGEIARNLFGLYSYCLNELSDANINDKTDPIDRTMKVLTELRQAWQQIGGEGLANGS